MQPIPVADARGAGEHFASEMEGALSLIGVLVSGE